jgi:ribose 5-phosphate isomerase A
MEKINLKKIVAEKAVEEIKPGMVVGLGTGSTFQFALERIAEKIKSGELYNIVCIPSSDRTEAEAKRLGIPLTSFEEQIRVESEERRVKNEEQNLNNSTLNTHHSTLIIDVTIDGADEVAVSDKGSIDVIKGGGGALLKEKILAQATKNFFVIVDESKISKHLGEKFFVPIEVIKFAVSIEEKFIQSLGAKTSLRKNANGENYITDENNYIIDATFGPIENVKELARKLEQRAGIVEHGLFVGMAKKVFCSMSNGEVKIIVGS